jgi:hypothetical protein
MNIPFLEGVARTSETSITAPSRWKSEAFDEVIQELNASGHSAVGRFRAMRVAIMIRSVIRGILRRHLRRSSVSSIFRLGPLEAMRMLTASMSRRSRPPDIEVQMRAFWTAKDWIKIPSAALDDASPAVPHRGSPSCVRRDHDSIARGRDAACPRAGARSFAPGVGGASAVPAHPTPAASTARSTPSRLLRRPPRPATLRVRADRPASSRPSAARSESRRRPRRQSMALPVRW